MPNDHTPPPSAAPSLCGTRAGYGWHWCGLRAGHEGACACHCGECFDDDGQVTPTADQDWPHDDFDADENDRHIRYLTDKLLGEFARPQSVIDADAVRRAIPFGAADERCRHGVRYGAYCPDCAASEGIRRGRVA